MLNTQQFVRPRLECFWTLTTQGLTCHWVEPGHPQDRTKTRQEAESSSDRKVA
jgi:hypothetical protein